MTTTTSATPGEAFQRAKDAVDEANWEAFYASLDRRDILTLVRNGLNVALSVGADDTRFRQACTDAGFPLEPVAAALARADWKAHRAELDAGLDLVEDLATFAAAVERHVRRLHGGGSVSSTLFQGEELRDVEEDGNRAWGMRYDAHGRIDPVGFSRRRGSWYVRLLARAPGRS
jgi:hypothetical protein